MPFDAGGNFSRNYNFEQDRINGIKIMSTRVDGEFDNYAAGLNATFLRTGAVPMGGNLRMGGYQLTGLADGSLASPAWQFSSEASTGMFRSAPGELAMSGAGVNIGRFNATGAYFPGLLNVTGAATVTGLTTLNGGFNVIGTGYVSTNLGVGGVLTVSSNAGITGTLGVTGATVLSSTLNVTGNSVLSTLSTSGLATLNSVNVTNAATLNSTLAVTGTSTFTGGVTANGAVAINNNMTFAGGTDIFTSVNNSSLAISGGTAFNTGGSIALRGSASAFNVGGIEFYAGGTERLRIDSAGNVGIGVLFGAPAGALDIQRAGSGTAQIYARNATHIASMWADASQVLMGAGSNSNVLFVQNNVERMRLDTSGRLGIGGAPSYFLDVYGFARVLTDTASGVALDLRGRSTDNVSKMRFLNNASSIEYGSLLHDSGNMYVTNSTGAGSLVFQTVGTNRGYWDSAGTLVQIGTTIFVNTNKALVQHDGTNGFFRSQTGSCYFGANAINAMQIDTAGVIKEVASGNELGFKDIPQNNQGGAYTIALGDRGKHIMMSTAGPLTIPANASVAFPIGSVVGVFNNSGGNLTINITTDTLRQAGTSNTGSRTLALNGVASMLKVGATTWVISGTGLS